MAEIARPSGLRITLPDTYEIIEEATTPTSPGSPTQSETRGPVRRPRGRRFGPVPIPAHAGLSEEGAALIAAFEQQEMKLVDTIELSPTRESTPPTGIRRRGAPRVPDKQRMMMEIDVKPGEDAALLVEQEGVYSWVFPDEGADAATAGTPRGTRVDTRAARRIRFHIDAHAGSASERRRDRRGFFTDLIYARVKALVLKFTARILVGQAMKFLERNVSRGIVVVDSADPGKWRRVEDISAVTLPDNRPVRVLLLVHGTFSSTAGSFGALGGTPWGKEFIETAIADYDAVIGFDHPTLSVDPLVNAVDLLIRLQKGRWSHTPQFDAVAFSRGALVYRSLVEHLLPTADWGARFERAVFVGSTNGGTALAEPANWHALVDLYTNLATGVSRLVGLMPQATAVVKIISEVVQGVGALVKYMATGAITDSDVPGLAAMAPKGEFITRINETQPGQPMPEKTWYYAITSSFAARVLDGDHEPKELPRRLVLALADGFVDELMDQAPNDLVVDKSSMTMIDPRAGQYVRDTLDFGETPQVYHLNYFTRPEVTKALTRWLQLSEPSVGRRTPGTGLGGLRKSRNAARWRFLAAGITPSEVPAVVDTDIMVTDVSTPVVDAVMDIKETAPSCVVMRRPYQGKILNYAMPTEDLLSRLRDHSTSQGLLDALNLHEYEQTHMRSVSSVRAFAPESLGGEMEVVVAGNEPVGVLRPRVALPGAGQLVGLANEATAPGPPKMPEDVIAVRRAMPNFMDTLPPMNPVANGVEDRDSGAKPSTVTCHFRAEMDEEVLLKRVTTIEVTVSRGATGHVRHETADEAAGEVDPARQLIIQVIPKRNFEMAGDEEFLKIEMPGPEENPTYYFDVRATHDDGGEGELWVIARQGQVPLVRLTLRPRIVTRRAGSVRRDASTATASEARAPSEPLTQLFITEQINGYELRYHYQLQNPGLGILSWDVSKPILGGRAQYVNKLYSEIENRWVSSAGDVDDFYQELRAYGAELFDELVPAKIQRELWEHRDQIESIMVISEEPFIPWEVVHVVEPGRPLGPGTRFFGEMGLVRWLEEAGWPTETIPFGTGRMRYVIPEYPHEDYELPEALREKAFLEEKFNATAVAPTSRAVRKLLSSPGDFDVLHFACHGEAEQGDVANAALLLQGRLEEGYYLPDYFNATTAEYHSNLQRGGGPGPMIVLNACQVGRAGYKLTGTGGFARAFLRRGASAFVGTLWSVGDSPARQFTTEFYTQLNENGGSIAEATNAARVSARKAGDATWLAYVVYGHPHAKLV